MFTFHSDPSHAWLAVSKSMLRTLGIDRQISKYSYQDHAKAYLEEDCDATLFFAAYREKFGMDPPIKESHRDGRSPIRSLATYRCDGDCIRDQIRAEQAGPNNWPRDYGGADDGFTITSDADPGL